MSVAGAQSTPPEEPTDPTERARLHFKLGVDFYRERNYRAALIEFQRAYAASPHYKLLYNLGQASLELQEDSHAIDYYSRYLREGGSELTDARRSEVEQNIVRLRARLATVTLTTNQAGAEIYVDDTLIGTAPLSEPLKVSVGRRRFVAVKHGFPDAERVVDVAAGDELDVELEFKERAQLDLAKLEGVLNKRDEEAAPSPALWTGIATGLIGAGAITASILTMTAQQDYDDELKVETTRTKLQELRDDANTKAVVADVLWGVTIVGVGVTTVLLIADGGEETEKKPEPAVALQLSPASVAVNGRF
ncbi:MAG TPA: PEGA domain-containing protein [Polyangiales bacterium]|nr:PEGA domain-containing protein [Polyangiales bacterium]